MFVPHGAIKLMFVLGTGFCLFIAWPIPPLCEWGLCLFLML